MHAHATRNVSNMRMRPATYLQDRHARASAPQPMQASSKSAGSSRGFWVAVAAGGLLTGCVAWGVWCLVASKFRGGRNASPKQRPSSKSTTPKVVAAANPAEAPKANSGARVSSRSARQARRQRHPAPMMTIEEPVLLDYSERWGPAHGNDGEGVAFRVSNLAAALQHCASRPGAFNIRLQQDAPAEYHAFWHQQYKHVLYHLNLVLALAEKWDYDEEQHMYKVQPQYGSYDDRY